MNSINSKLNSLKDKIDNNQSIEILIFGLGSVGNYLLNYLAEEKNINITVVGRSTSKMISDVNICKIASCIRNGRSAKISIREADLNNVEQLSSILNNIKPDFIVNSSRAYSHLKYGSISWKSLRAYGIWSPLSIKYIKNIMKAVEQASPNSIVINTSYSDATNRWLKTANKFYPDFGSGNLNHLVPRIKFAFADTYKINDIENIDVTIATSHFHDVLISKEGITNNINPLLKVIYKGSPVNIDETKIYSMCAIDMPTDEKRNMMNASSNFEIIKKIITAAQNNTIEKFHSPGVFGLLGGYPVCINFKKSEPISIFETYFSKDEMTKVNKNSIYQDGIEEVEDGYLVYTDELISKTQAAFNYTLPKKVHLDESNTIADQLIKNVIEKAKS